MNLSQATPLHHPEELVELLRKPLSKSYFNMLAGLLQSRTELVSEVLTVIGSGKGKDPERASWLLSNLWDIDSEVLRPFQHELIRLLLSARSDSVRRNLLRIIDAYPLPDEQLGDLYDVCMAWMLSERFSIAVRCNAMQILYRICVIEPDLSDELVQRINDLLVFGSAGFQSRGQKIIRLLKNPPNS
ncbi:MAG: hypothetical protein Q8S18_11535 [Bacteroidales bacterium]|nr:hypothetical protein [Bacteroidales bacterium]